MGYLSSMFIMLIVSINACSFSVKCFGHFTYETRILSYCVADVCHSNRYKSFTIV